MDFLKKLYIVYHKVKECWFVCSSPWKNRFLGTANFLKMREKEVEGNGAIMIHGM